GKCAAGQARRAGTTAVLDFLVQPALAFEAEETGVLLAHARLPATGGVGVADGDIALLPQRVVGQVMLLEIAPHVAVVPVGDRVDLPASVAPLQDRCAAAAARLHAAQAGEPGAGLQLGKRALPRFDLAQVVVLLDADQPLLPKPAMARFHPRAADQDRKSTRL